MVLFEYLEHLVLLCHLRQFAGISQVGNTQQQSVVIFLEPEEVYFRGVGQQRTIIIVHIIVYLIICGIDRTLAFEQLHFGLVAFRLKHSDGIFGGYLVAGDGHFFVNDLLHSFAYALHVFLIHGVPDLQIHIVSVAHGYVYG